jgi:hypothetical protein
MEGSISMKKAFPGAATIREGMLAKDSAFEFKRQPEGHYIADPANPALAVAFDELRIREFLQRNGLHVQDPIHFGRWSGRRSH